MCFAPVLSLMQSLGYSSHSRQSNDTNEGESMELMVTAQLLKTKKVSLFDTAYCGSCGFKDSGIES